MPEMPKTFSAADKARVPAAAFRLSEKPFALAETDGEKFPVRLVCRTAAPVDSFFWGKCYHDLDGMKLAKERLPIDYVHDDGEVVGFLDRFAVENRELVATGELTPFKDDDRASELIHKLKAGVPYEASINFAGPTRIEEVSDGASATVNGETVVGPCTIFREWTLRGVAICPYGADGETSTAAEFSAEGETVAVDVVEPAKPEEPAEEAKAEEPAPVAEPAPAPAEEAKLSAPPAEDPRALFSRMKKNFGLDIAARVFADGGTYEDARDAKFAELQQAVARLQAENARLASAAASAPAGGTPAHFVSAAKPEPHKPTLAELCRVRRS